MKGSNILNIGAYNENNISTIEGGIITITTTGVLTNYGNISFYGGILNNNGHLNNEIMLTYNVLNNRVYCKVTNKGTINNNGSFTYMGYVSPQQTPTNILSNTFINDGTINNSGELQLNYSPNYGEQYVSMTNNGTITNTDGSIYNTSFILNNNIICG